MRLKNSSLLLTVSLLIYLSSCQKEASTTNDNIPPGNNDSTYLNKLYITQGTTTIDTIETATFFYDGLKRVVSMISGFKTGSYIHQRSYFYFYNGNDTIPYKTNYYYADDSGNDTAVTYHYYDISHRNLTDSVLSSQLTIPSGFYTKLNQTAHYSYAAGKKYAYTTLEYPLSPTNNSNRKDTATIDGNNNITLNKGYFPSFPGPGYDQQTNSVLTYDNQVNPFRLLSSYKAHQRFPHGETLYFEHFSYNNILTQTETQWGSSPLTTTYSYNYKSNGLPSGAQIVFDGTDIYYVSYTYKKL